MKTEYYKKDDRYYRYCKVDFDCIAFKFPKWCENSVLKLINFMGVNEGHCLDLRGHGYTKKNIAALLSNDEYIVQDIETEQFTVQSVITKGVFEGIEERDLPENIKRKIGVKILPKIIPCIFCKLGGSVIEGTWSTKGNYMVKCKNIHDCSMEVCTQWEETEEDAINVWNKHMRKYDHRLDALPLFMGFDKGEKDCSVLKIPEKPRHNRLIVGTTGMHSYPHSSHSSLKICELTFAPNKTDISYLKSVIAQLKEGLSMLEDRMKKDNNDE